MNYCTLHRGRESRLVQRCNPPFRGVALAPCTCRGVLLADTSGSTAPGESKRRGQPDRFLAMPRSRLRPALVGGAHWTCNPSARRNRLTDARLTGPVPVLCLSPGRGVTDAGGPEGVQHSNGNGPAACISRLKISTAGACLTPVKEGPNVEA